MKIILKESQFLRLIHEERGGSNKLSQDEFIKRAQTVHSENGNPKYDYSLVDYVDSGTKVKVICPKHRDEWIDRTGNEYFEIIPSKHLEGQGCRFDYLESKRKYTDSELEKEAKQYKTTSEFKKNSFLHFNAALKRGREFYDKITAHFIPETESSGEKLVAKILVDNNFIDESCLESRKCDFREKTFENCTNTKVGRYCQPLRFDFYIPDKNTIIEYDGEQHFRPSEKFGGTKFEVTKENDRIKNEFCEKNGINLIRIHYKFPTSKIESALLDALQNPKPLTLIGNYSTNI
jgi:very-short-patch-repair endonuclease